MRPQSVITTNREYPLRETMLESWAAVGVQAVPFLDANAGHPQGVGDLAESRWQGRREIASVIYSLDGVTVLTETQVAKILTSKTADKVKATGIQLANGTQILGKEMILSAGAIHTPQILMLSGIGPAEELTKHNISVVLDVPDVGQNFADHTLAATEWYVQDSEVDNVLGSGNPLFDEEQYGWGSPADFITSTTVPLEGLAAAIEADEGVAPDSVSEFLNRRNSLRTKKKENAWITVADLQNPDAPLVAKPHLLRARDPVRGNQRFDNHRESDRSAHNVQGLHQTGVF